MNQVLADLLANPNAVETLQAGLPLAFEQAEVEARRISLNQRTGKAQEATGQEVGVTREHVMVAYLTSRLGTTGIELPVPGATMVDVLVAEQS